MSINLTENHGIATNAGVVKHLHAGIDILTVHLAHFTPGQDRSKALDPRMLAMLFGTGGSLGQANAMGGGGGTAGRQFSPFASPSPTFGQGSPQNLGTSPAIPGLMGAIRRRMGKRRGRSTQATPKSITSPGAMPQ